MEDGGYVRDGAVERGRPALAARGRRGPSALLAAGRRPRGCGATSTAGCRWNRAGPMIHVELVRGRRVLPLGGPPAADGGRVGGGGVRPGDGSAGKRRFPWGDDRSHARARQPRRRCARLRRRRRAAGRRQRLRLPPDDRQRLGVDRRHFCPYPGFTPDMYREYSAALVRHAQGPARRLLGDRGRGCCATPGATSIRPTAATSGRGSAPARSEAVPPCPGPAGHTGAPGLEQRKPRDRAALGADPARTGPSRPGPGAVHRPGLRRPGRPPRAQERLLRRPLRP